MEAANSDVEALSGGNASASVLRIGNTVRKPWLQTTDLTVAYMRALRDRGIDLPEPRGRDDKGRLVLEYVPGDLASARGPLDPSLLRRVGALVRTIHDASFGLAVPDAWEVLLPADRRPPTRCTADDDGAARTRHARPSPLLARVQPETVGVDVRRGTRRALERRVAVIAQHEQAWRQALS